MGLDSLTDIWSAICAELKNEEHDDHLSDVAFNAWIKVLEPLNIQDGYLVLGVKSDVKRKIIDMTYNELLQKYCLLAAGLPLKIKIVLIGEDEEPDEIEILNDDITPEFTFDNFVVGKSNEFAHAVAVAVANKPAPKEANIARHYNPLYIYGDSGVGKTHLMIAIKNRIAELYPDLKMVFIRGEEFLNQYIENTQNKTMVEFREKFRNIDVLFMDDIHFLAGKDSTQEEFFNTFNELYNSSKQIVVTSDRPPKEIKAMEERIKTRLEGGMLVSISPPDYETRVGIVRNKSHQLEVPIKEDLTYFIAEQVKMNTRQLEGIVKKLKAFYEIRKSDITVATVQNFIRDIISSSAPEPVTVERVVDEVSRTYGVSYDDIFSKKRSKNIAYARQVSMYILRETTQMVYDEIAEKFNRDHTTVMYNINVVADEMKKNPKEKEIIEDIIKNLKT